MDQYPFTLSRECRSAISVVQLFFPIPKTAKYAGTGIPIQNNLGVINYRN
jgi:hypothetical protein